MSCWRHLSFTVFLASSTLVPAGFAADESVLKAWIQAQSEIASLTGSFTQERKLRVMKKVLVAPGRFWYRAPDQFRWDIGQPVRSVALQSQEKFTVIDLDKGKAVVEGAGDDGSRMAAYLRMSFPRDWETFKRQFRVLSVARSGNVIRADVEPLDPGAARGVRSIGFEIDARSYATTAFVLDLKDGSEMRTTFTEVKRDVPVSASTFEVSLDGLRVKDKGS